MVKGPEIYENSPLLDFLFIYYLERIKSLLGLSAEMVAYLKLVEIEFIDLLCNCNCHKFRKVIKFGCLFRYFCVEENSIIKSSILDYVFFKICEDIMEQKTSDPALFVMYPSHCSKLRVFKVGKGEV